MEIQPEIIQGSYSALEVPEDIAKYREFFGREHDADDRYITAYKDWKAYAEYYGTEIQPVDETELAQWRARVFAEHPERYRNVDGSPYVPPGKRKEGASSNKIDALMRRIFGLSEK